jgi:hypothetical protein
MNDKPHQPKLHYEDFNDALHDLVQALGGFKKVGPKLWPALPAEDAAHRLRHCLNRDRREKLAPDELRLLLRWGCEAEFHGAKYFLDDDAGYGRTAPLDPREEKSKAAMAVQAAAEALTRATAALERANASEQQALLRAVK